jgi:hypothetical protein
MRIGVFHEAPYYLRYYATALTALADRGHRLLLARPDRYDEVPVPKALRKRSEVSTALYPWDRADGREKTASIVRAARDFARYSGPPLDAAHANRARAFERLLRAVVGKGRSLAADVEPLELSLDEADRGVVDGFFRDLESLIPPDEGVCAFIREHKLDLVVCVSRVNIAARQTEVVKAAKSLGVPTGIVVYSWDNLSSKGLLHEQPDRLFVWNEVQAGEAEELHGVDRGRIAITGAVRFDDVFDRAPSADRADLQRELGLDPERSTVLYLGSSKFVAPREPEFVDRWIEAVRGSGDERLASANLIVRPHPGTVGDAAWAEWRPPAGAVLPPPVGKRRDQDLFDQIFAGDAVVSLNTSAEIEAAIVGRPVLTIRAGSIAPGQQGSVHFHYLLDEEGGFVQTAAALDEHVGQLSRALEHDPLAAERARFLETFVRPNGIDAPAGPALADAIEELGEGRVRPWPRVRRPGRAAAAS